MSSIAAATSPRPVQVDAGPAVGSTPPTGDAPWFSLTGGLVLSAVGVAAAVAVGRAGAAMLNRPVASRVIGAVDGVQLLSNPRLPRHGHAAYGVPTKGSLFGAEGSAKVSLEHVDQGALPDCWNIAGMGAIAQRRPEALEAMVRPAGDHVIVDLPSGPVAVTRELPLDRSGVPAFAGSGSDDVVHWPGYIQKAQAALAADGYRSLDGGAASTAFRQLLGSNPVVVRSRGTMIDDVAHHVKLETPVALGTRPKSATNADTRALMAELDIKANHYYVPTEVSGHGDDTTVTLFNTWGEQHPKRALRPDELQRMFDRLDTPDEIIGYVATRA